MKSCFQPLIMQEIHFLCSTRVILLDIKTFHVKKTQNCTIFRKTVNINRWLRGTMDKGNIFQHPTWSST